MSSEDEITDKAGEPIHVGDTISAKARAGKHAGEVTDVVTDDIEAAQKGLKNPPKVVLVDQHGHEKAQNPESTVHGEDPK